jgi:hypothetical protein
MLLARLTRIPLLGRLVRRLANGYAKNQHGGFLLNLEEAEKIIDASETVSLGPCSCRQVFSNCQRPVMSEIVVGAGPEVYAGLDGERFRKISHQEAKEIMRDCHSQGMLHTIMHCRGLFYAICNCCSCCCVPFRLRKNYGIEYAIIRSRDTIDDYHTQRMSDGGPYAD